MLVTARRGDGHPVLVLPGLMSGDPAILALRTALRALDHNVSGWRLGLNRARRAGWSTRCASNSSGCTGPRDGGSAWSGEFSAGSTRRNWPELRRAASADRSVSARRCWDRRPGSALPRGSSTAAPALGAGRRRGRHQPLRRVVRGHPGFLRIRPPGCSCRRLQKQVLGPCPVLTRWRRVRRMSSWASSPPSRLITDELWALVEPLIQCRALPDPVRGPRPRHR
jgi:hypothetical protein